MRWEEGEVGDMGHGFTLPKGGGGGGGGETGNRLVTENLGGGGGEGGKTWATGWFTLPGGHR